MIVNTSGQIAHRKLFMIMKLGAWARVGWAGAVWDGLGGERMKGWVATQEGSGW